MLYRNRQREDIAQPGVDSQHIMRVPLRKPFSMTERAGNLLGKQLDAPTTVQLWPARVRVFRLLSG